MAFVTMPTGDKALLAAPLWTAEVPPYATAFPLRENHWMVEFLPIWDNSPAHNGREEMRWADQLDCEVSGIACAGGYVNILKPAAAPDRARRR